MNEPYNFDTNDFCPGVSCYNMKCPTNNYDDLSFSFSKKFELLKNLINK